MAERKVYGFLIGTDAEVSWLMNWRNALENALKERN